MATPKNEVVEKDNGLKKLFKKLRVLDGLEVVAGIPDSLAESRTYPDGTPLKPVAWAHEFGNPEGADSVPPGSPPMRSFIRSTFDENARKYARLQELAAEAVIKKTTSPKIALMIAGETAKTDIIAKIKSNIGPPLSAKPEAVKRRGGRTLALVETELLLGSIRSFVRKEKP